MAQNQHFIMALDILQKTNELDKNFRGIQVSKPIRVESEVLQKTKKGFC